MNPAGQAATQTPLCRYVSRLHAVHAVASVDVSPMAMVQLRHVDSGRHVHVVPAGVSPLLHGVSTLGVGVVCGAQTRPNCPLPILYVPAGHDATHTPLFRYAPLRQFTHWIVIMLPSARRDSITHSWHEPTPRQAHAVPFGSMDPRQATGAVTTGSTHCWENAVPWPVWMNPAGHVSTHRPFDKTL